MTKNENCSRRSTPSERLSALIHLGNSSQGRDFFRCIQTHGDEKVRKIINTFLSDNNEIESKKEVEK